MADQGYKSFIYRLTTKGLVAKYARDRSPQETFWNTDNLEERQDGSALSSRLGRSAITTDGTNNVPLADTNVVMLGRLKSTAQTYRYAGAGTNLYRRAGDTNGAYTQISPKFSAGARAPLSAIQIASANVAWTLPGANWSGGASTANGAWVILPGAASQSQELDLTNLGFNIPSNATVTGIQVVATSTRTGSLVGTVTEQISLKGITGGASKNGTGGAKNTYGGTSDLWGGTITPAQVNNSAFGVAILEILSGGGGGNNDTIAFASQTAVTITVYYTQAALLSGGRFSAGVYRPDFSGTPYIFFADKSSMLKDSGTNLQPWGILPPLVPPGAFVQVSSLTVVENFEADVGFSYVNFTVPGGGRVGTRVNTTLSAGVPGGQVSTVAVAAMTNITPGVLVLVDTAGNQETVLVISTTATAFTAYFSKTHASGVAVVSNFIQGTVASSTTATVTKSGAQNLDSVGGVQASDSDYINIVLQISNPSYISEIKLLFDVGDGSFTQDYYHKSINPPSYQAVVDGSVTSFVGGSKRIADRASAQIDVRRNRTVFEGIEDDLLPTDDLRLRGLQPRELMPGQSVWSFIQIKRGDFLKIGQAGLPGKAWANVNAFRVLVTTNSNGSPTVGIDSLYLSGGTTSGPDILAGVPYDYRITYYNANTGAESLPSVPMVTANFVSPNRQPVRITWLPSGDSQVTHARVYRRGGTLPSQWLKIIDATNTDGQYTDAFADQDIVSNKVLELDNDPPLTTSLPSPVLTTLGTSVTAGSVQTVTPASMTNIFANQFLTIDVGSSAETVIVISTTGTTFTAYFQSAHTSSAQVFGTTRTARAVNLGAIAFQRAWLAGDPDGPNRLYYSKPQRPESFPLQNYIEIGEPDDPIMAVVAPHRGQLFVMTLSRVWRILDLGSGVPIPIPTASRVGLKASFAWTIAEGAIIYLSHDGVYAFTGEQSTLLSDPISWLVENKEPNLGPVKELDPAQMSDAVMAYHRNEIFLSYLDKTSTRRRIVANRTSGTWRNDSVPAVAMNYEEDTATLVIARSNGMIYQDRVGDVDGEGFAAGVAQNSPIALTMETPSWDQGVPDNDKNYNEVIIDLDSGGQNVAVTLLFDYGATAVSLGSISTTSRNQVSLAINSGQGQTSKNIAIRFTASASSGPIHLYTWQVKAVVEAEQRLTYDSYFVNLGTPQFKIMKEGWFIYKAPDAAGVTFNFYIEGASTAEFSFTLPQATVRTSKRVRFPATKAKLWRLVGTSPTNFQFYPDTFFHMKAVAGKSYSQIPLPEEAP